jgi:hypothetical protein
MATLGSNVLTLADWAKRLDPDGKVPKIVEMLSQSNEVLQDMLFIEGNLPTGHRSTVRTSLPSVQWRLINQGVTPSKSTTAQVDEACGMLEAWSEVDVELAKLGGNVSAFRLSEASAFVEAMGQEHASTLFYGNHATAPEEFTGLAARYNSLSGVNAENILSGGGAGSDNASVYLCVWGQNSLHGIFPKGSKAGIEHKDMGEVTVETTAGIAGSRMRAYQDQFLLKTGLVLKDWRYVVRVANIDISNLVTKSSAADLIELMIKAIHRIPSLNAGKAAFYMNRTCLQMLDIQMRDDVLSGGQLKYENVEGKPVMNFRGIPVRKCDALLENEQQVS